MNALDVSHHDQAYITAQYYGFGSSCLLLRNVATRGTFGSPSRDLVRKTGVFADALLRSSRKTI